MKNKKWEVTILLTGKKYNLAAMHFMKRSIEIYADEEIRTTYGFNEVRVFHGEHEIDMKKGE
jgi:hypothetical protein